jgi:predicted Zn-dependent peptidase
VPKAELQRACDYIVGQIDLSLENSENQMMWVGEHLLGYGKVFDPEVVKARTSKVKPSEVRAAAQEFFRPERYSLALISPLKKADAIVKLLQG